jgi:secreted Zn-dependent insulinase-like peptidase
MFEIKADLTVAGYEHRHEVVDCIFAYLATLHKHTTTTVDTSAQEMDSIIPTYLFDETKQLSTIGFTFAEKRDIVDTCVSLAEDMNEFKDQPQLYLTGGRVFGRAHQQTHRSSDKQFTDAAKASVNKYLAEQLTVNQAVIKLISKSVFNETNTTNTKDIQESEYYGARYRLVDMSVDDNKHILDRWQQRRNNDMVDTELRNSVVEDLIAKFVLPPPNEFIPTDFSTHSNNHSDPGVATVTQESAQYSIDDNTLEQLRRDPLNTPPIQLPAATANTHELWYKADTHFNQPKTYVIINYGVPVTNKQTNDPTYSPRLQAQMSIFIACFYDMHKSYLARAAKGGLSVRLGFTPISGLQLVFTGYTHKMGLFIESVLDKVNTFTLSAAESESPDSNTIRFHRFKDMYLRQLNSWTSEQSYSHCMYYIDLATTSTAFPREQLIHAVDNVQLTDFADSNNASSGHFITNTLLPNNTSYCTALIMGSATAEYAQEIMKNVTRVFNVSNALAPSERLKRRTVMYPSIKDLNLDREADNRHYGSIIRNTHPNPENVNNAVVFSFQFPDLKVGQPVTCTNSSDDDKWKYIETCQQLELLSDLIQEPFYNLLRTQQQCGYIVNSQLSVIDDVYTLSLLVQSSEKSTNELTARMEGFVEYFLRTVLKDMTHDTFDNYKQGRITTKLEPDQRLTEQATRFWSDIYSAAKFDDENCSASDSWRAEPQFYRLIDEVKVLRDMTLPEIRQAAEALLSVKSTQRRLIVSQVEKYGNDNEVKNEGKADSVGTYEDESLNYVEEDEKGILVPKRVVPYAVVSDPHAFRTSRQLL